MLVIRLARTGKKNQAYFRIVVADSKKSPTAKFVEIVGNYDPHAKKITVKKDRVDFYMKNGAQPSNTVAKLFKKEKISMPNWVKITEKKKAPKTKEETKEVKLKEQTEGEAQAEEKSAEESKNDKEMQEKNIEAPAKAGKEVATEKTEDQVKPQDAEVAD